MEKRCMGCMSGYNSELEICPYCGYIDGTPAEEAIHIQPGTLLYDRYIVGKVIGYGGFGVTYVGWDGKLEQKVAIKEYLPSEFSTRVPGATVVTVFEGEKREQYSSGLVKFVEEAKHLAKFQSEDGIVKVFDSFEENDTAYIIMEYLEGETLKDYLAREKVIDENKAVQMLMPIMQSLRAVHAEGLLHRDIAPDNIFITKDGEVKLIDFGASRYATTSYSRSLTVVIKPGYSPEEQYRSRGDQGAYTDVYAVAATLYKMITGVTPPDAMERRAKAEGQKKDILEEPHKINKNISINRENAILNAMNIRIEDRTPDIAAFVKELEADPPAKRIYGAIKKVDLFHWPLWLKILVPSLLCVALVFGALVVTGVIDFKSSYDSSVKVPDGMVVVPGVEGVTLEEAIGKIEEAGLTPLAKEKVKSEFVQQGKVVYQTPSKNMVLEPNTVIELTVSDGTGEVQGAQDGQATVPYVVLDTEADAIDKLTKAGLRAQVSYEYGDTAEGLVASQSITADVKVDEGTTVKIVVSLGQEKFDVPNVIGKTEAEAKKLLEDAGFVVKVQTVTATENVGKVLGQSIDGGDKATKGTEIVITVAVAQSEEQSTTPATTTTPKPETTTKKTTTTTTTTAKKKYTVSFDANGGKVSSSSKTYTQGDTIGSVSATRDYYTFDGWYTSKSGGSPVHSYDTVTGNVTLYAHWTENELSGWVPASSAPSDAKIKQEKWTYTQTEYTTGTSSTKSGWTLYDSTWEWGSYGSWSSWSKTSVSSSDSREVQTKTVTDTEGYYKYKYWIYRSSDGYSCGTRNFTPAGGTICTRYDEINLTYALPLYDSSNGLYGPYNSSMFSHGYDKYWFYDGRTWVSEVTHTEYRYRERSKEYTYYFKREVDKEYETDPSNWDNVYNVEHLVRYIAK